MSDRIKKVFSDKKKKLVTFVTGGDPDFITIPIGSLIDPEYLDHRAKLISKSQFIFGLAKRESRLSTILLLIFKLAE